MHRPDNGEISTTVFNARGQSGHASMSDRLPIFVGDSPGDCPGGSHLELCIFECLTRSERKVEPSSPGIALSVLGRLIHASDRHGHEAVLPFLQVSKRTPPVSSCLPILHFRRYRWTDSRPAIAAADERPRKNFCRARRQRRSGRSFHTRQFDIGACHRTWRAEPDNKPFNR
jgi:hypothetical protein